MGKKKIELKQIENKQQSKITFKKRRQSILNKAMELSILCGVQVYLHISYKNAQIKPLLFHSHNLQEMKAKMKMHIKDKNKRVYFKEDYNKFLIGRGHHKKKKNIFLVTKETSPTVSNSSQGITCTSIQNPPSEICSYPPSNNINNIKETQHELTTISDDDDSYVKEDKDNNNNNNDDNDKQLFFG